MADGLAKSNVKTNISLGQKKAKLFAGNHQGQGKINMAIELFCIGLLILPFLVFKNALLRIIYLESILGNFMLRRSC